MQEVRELKNVLERVEGKLVVAEKAYAALNFAVWLTIMAGYYIMLPFTGSGRAVSMAYWLTGGSIGVYFTGRVWKRYLNLTARNRRGGKRKGARIALSWLIGSVTGWIVVPAVAKVGGDTLIGLSLLTFISVSLFGQTLTIGDRESIPSFLIPAIAVPFLFGLHSGASTWAGFVIATGFGMTIVLYLHSAFKVIER
ncbi:hypothetical protein [Thermococcus sp.]